MDIRAHFRIKNKITKNKVISFFEKKVREDFINETTTKKQPKTQDRSD